jgi:hypothetical protein
MGTYGRSTNYQLSYFTLSGPVSFQLKGRERKFFFRGGCNKQRVLMIGKGRSKEPLFHAFYFDVSRSPKSAMFLKYCTAKQKVATSMLSV